LHCRLKRSPYQLVPAGRMLSDFREISVMILAINNQMRQNLGRYRRSQDGVTAIEFALVAGPFFFTLIVMFELGIMLFAEYALAQNIESAGRLIRTGQIQNGENGHLATPAYFKSQVCKNMTAMLDCDNKLYVDVRKFSDFASIAGNLPSPYEPGTNELSDDITTGTQYQPGEAGEIVSIRVYYDWQLVTPFLGMLISPPGTNTSSVTSLGNVSASRTSRLLTAAATFRNEPFTKKTGS